MRKLVNSIIIIAFMAFIFTSCDEKGDPIIPDDPGTETEHVALWTYDLGFGTLDDITPAIDENDNIYFAMHNMDEQNVAVFGLDKSGNELWKKVIEGVSTSKVIYDNNKVYVSSDNPYAIHCLNASSGETDWTKNFSDDYDFNISPVMALSNDRIYIYSGMIFYSYLVALDLNGNEVWLKPIFDKYSMNLSVSGSSLYFYDTENLYRYDDMGTSCDSIWSYEIYAYKNSNEKMLTLALMDIPIGDDGNIYVRTQDIHIVSPQGELVKKIELDDSFNSGANSNITLTSNNDIIIGDANLAKFNSDGNMDWITDITGVIVTPYFSSAATIASNGDLYDAQTFGLFCVNSDGSLDWEVTAENGGGTEHVNLHPPVLNHEGNIISVAAEASQIRCFKGDGNGLASSGWPKPFANYGNTSSR
jgi:outer membrane protein assembly factor BamB